MPHDVRRKLAEIAHEAWSTQPFDPKRDTEDWDVADAILARFEVNEILVPNGSTQRGRHMDTVADKDAVQRDGSIGSELDAAGRVYAAIIDLDPRAARRACEWALSRHDEKHWSNQSEKKYSGLVFGSGLLGGSATNTGHGTDKGSDVWIGV